MGRKVSPGGDRRRTGVERRIGSKGNGQLLREEWLIFSGSRRTYGRSLRARRCPAIFTTRSDNSCTHPISSGRAVRPPDRVGGERCASHEEVASCGGRGRATA